MIDDYIWNWHDQQCDQNWRNFAALALFERSKHLSKLRIYFGKCYCAIGQYFIAVNGQILIKWGSYLVTLNRPVKNRIVMAIILYLPPSPPGSRESVISSSCLFSNLNPELWTWSVSTICGCSRIASSDRCWSFMKKGIRLSCSVWRRIALPLALRIADL